MLLPCRSQRTVWAQCHVLLDSFAKWFYELWYSSPIHKVFDQGMTSSESKSYFQNIQSVRKIKQFVFNTFSIYFLEALKLLAPNFLLSCYMIARPNFSSNSPKESWKDAVNCFKFKLRKKLKCSNLPILNKTIHINMPIHSCRYRDFFVFIWISRH